MCPFCHSAKETVTTRHEQLASYQCDSCHKYWWGALRPVAHADAACPPTAREIECGPADGRSVWNEQAAGRLSPLQPLPCGDRRRAKRVRPVLTRVEAPRANAGALVDLSELGALVRLRNAPSPGTQITLELEGSESLAMLARVVRATPSRFGLRGAASASIDYDVALEFAQMPHATVTALRRVIESATC